ncbi:MAG: hypothetical protein RLZZ244_1617, partial [Verrucomicrobiota bacterium]
RAHGRGCCRRGLLWGGAWLWGGGGERGWAEGKEETWRVWLEARFVRPAVSAPIPGAQRTVLALGEWDGMRLRAFTREEWAAQGAGWEEGERRARAQCARDLERVESVVRRDRRGVVESVELRSVEPRMASAVLAPGFGERFAEWVGEGCLLVVPNRHQAWVFPKHASVHARYTAEVLRAYAATSSPVSVELLEWSGAGLKAVGVFENGRGF